MNVLIFGPRGFVGQHLVSRLEREGHNVFHGTRDYPLIPDLHDGEEYPKPDVIINAAGEITEKHKMYDDNVALVERILVFAQRVGVKKVIQIGSSSEYGAVSERRHEDMMCVPTDLYSATKIAATALCQGFAKQYDMDVVIARPFSLYGPNDTPRKLVPRLIVSHFGGDPVKVDPDPDHDWIHIDDFVDGLVTLMHAPKEKTQGDIVNFGTGVAHTNWQVVQQIEKLGYSPLVTFCPKPAHVESDPHWVADITKARVKYGWAPKITLEQGLRNLLT